MTAEVLAPEALRVVIVDDTADLRELLRFALIRGGMTVVGEAGDGRAGIEIVRSTRPDIVLLDLSMPIMDGLEALPQIRELAPEARIIVLSGFDAQQMTERALAIGADSYLQKGASLGRILDQIRDVVDRTATTPGTRVTPPSPVAPVQGGDPTRAARRDTTQRDALTLAPFGIIEVDAEPPYRLLGINEAARALLASEPEHGQPLDDVAPQIAAVIANSRLAGDGVFEATLNRQPILITLRHTETSLLLYLQATTDEVGHLRNAIATTAHEIRGPVAVLCAITETIREENLESHHVDRLMASITRQARLLDSITGDLLVAAQVQRGTLRMDVEELDPVALVATVMEDHSVPDDQIRISDHRMIRADPLRLQQMLGNLISNARKYGEPPIQLRIRPSTEHESLVCIDVVDRGPGIPEEFRPHLFREFSRAGGTSRAGTGLGLHVVHTLAQGQGGSVSYAPGLHRGSVFTLSLPAAVRRDPTT